MVSAAFAAREEAMNQESDGTAPAASIAAIVRTTSSSTRVKPRNRIDPSLPHEPTGRLRARTPFITQRESIAWLQRTRLAVRTASVPGLDRLFEPDRCRTDRAGAEEGGRYSASSRGACVR